MRKNIKLEASLNNKSDQKKDDMEPSYGCEKNGEKGKLHPVKNIKIQQVIFPKLGMID